VKGLPDPLCQIIAVQFQLVDYAVAVCFGFKPHERAAVAVQPFARISERVGRLRARGEHGPESRTGARFSMLLL